MALDLISMYLFEDDFSFSGNNGNVMPQLWRQYYKHNCLLSYLFLFLFIFSFFPIWSHLQKVSFFFV